MSLKRRGNMSLEKWVVCFILFSCSELFPQGEAAMPFLLLPGSTKLNGAGAAGTATLVDDPYKFFFNPAHLGFSSKTENFSSGFYPEKMLWLPGLSDGMTLNNYVFTAGYNLEKHYPQIPFSVGIGYSRSEMNFGTFYITGPDSPEPIGTFQSRDYYSAYSLGVGFHSIVNISAGFTIKDATSILSDSPTANETGSGTAKVTAVDYGLLITLPLNNLLKEPLRFGVSNNGYINADMDYTLGYAVQNIGDKIHYIDAAQSDPIGRTARLAHNLQLALNLHSDDLSLELINFSYSIDAEDILIKRSLDTITSISKTEYQGLLGDIKPLKNLFLAKGDPQVVLHKGLIVEFFEAITLAEGGFNGRGFDNRKTNGIGFRTKGLLKLINMPMRSETIDYIIKHFDIQYFKSNYFAGTFLESKFSALTITVGGF